MANLLCSPVLNQINAASGNPPVSRRHRDLVLASSGDFNVEHGRFLSKPLLLLPLISGISEVSGFSIASVAAVRMILIGEIGGISGFPSPSTRETMSHTPRQSLGKMRARVVVGVCKLAMQNH
jgi:hypothetical protein